MIRIPFELAPFKEESGILRPRLAELSVANLRAAESVLGAFESCLGRRRRELLRRLRTTPFFERVEFVEPVKDGFIVDTYSFPPAFMGERAVLLRKATYNALLRRLRERYGVDVVVHVEPEEG